MAIWRARVAERGAAPDDRHEQPDPACPAVWMMNYADALDQNQEPDKSWRLRRHLLSSEWAQAQQGRPMTRTQARAHWLTEEGLDTTRRLARARLLLTHKPGDPAFETLREAGAVSKEEMVRVLYRFIGEEGDPAEIVKEGQAEAESAGNEGSVSKQKRKPKGAKIDHETGDIRTPGLE